MLRPNRLFSLPRHRGYFLNNKNHHLPVVSDAFPSADGAAVVWRAVRGGEVMTPKLLVRSLGELSKFKLSALVVLTTMSGHIMAASVGGTSSASQLGLTLLGTTLCSFSANSLNQWAESPLDAQMPRTQNRPLPRLILTPFAAFNWSVLTGASGLAILAVGVNPVASALAGLTIALYAGVYTPLKRISIVNTWIGALVGAIPPLIGWTSVLPYLSLTSSTSSSVLASSLILPSLLFCWQFPHFNALSWNLRGEYARAGYQMTAVVNPKLNGRVALRYALALVPLTLTTGIVGLTSWTFSLLAGNLINAPLIWKAFKFRQNPTRKTARHLFFASLIHLPLYLVFLFIYREPITNDDAEAKSAQDTTIRT
jgi:heme o synthase